jgi:hypothetical protein
MTTLVASWWFHSHEVDSEEVATHCHGHHHWWAILVTL